MKLINLLIRELNNYSSGDDFRVSHHAEICQFDRLSLEVNFKEHVVVIMEFPDSAQVKKINVTVKSWQCFTSAPHIWTVCLQAKLAAVHNVSDKAFIMVVFAGTII